MSAPKVSDQVVELERKLADAVDRAQRAEEQLRAKPPFSHEQADSICRQVWDVLTGRTALPAGRRNFLIPVMERTSVASFASESARVFDASPAFRTVEVRW